ncbi:MAG: glycosyltransferase [Spirochaetes bacterium]|nr:glycosyltransferase [Spirochaetota bacterium]
MKRQVSLIITTYNQPYFLDLTLSSLTRQRFKDFEVLVADDGSDMRTSGVIKKYSGLCLTHIRQEDRGYRKALILNKAIKKAGADYLVFIDSDCVLHRDFLLYHYRKREKGCFLTGRRVELGDTFTRTLTPKKIEQDYLNRFNLDLLKSCLKKDSKHFHRSLPVHNSLIRQIARWDRVRDILGSNFSLYKEDLLRVNGFNQDLKHYWGEDGDLFLRLRNNRLKIRSVKNLAVQFHLYHTRRKESASFKKWYYDSVKNNFTYRQCLNGLKKIKEKKAPAVTIVVPTYNQIRFTRQCLRSLFQCTKVNFELVLIDNGSRDDTPLYLKQLKKKHKNIRLILNRTNQGVARAWNRGITIARSDFVAVLNNDIVVTQGWLTFLLKFSIEKGYLFVGPAYREGKLDYDLTVYADKFVKRNRKRERKNTYTGFAMLFDKSIFKQTGYFSTEYRIGTYEDADFIMRLKQKNIPYSTTGSSFIHHYKSQTQQIIRQREGNEYELENRKKFYKKWHVNSLKGITLPKNKWEKRMIQLKNLFSIW